MDIYLSFSQNNEDMILFNMLREIPGKDIRWIDVGANDPIDISVTKFFSIRGGYGINIEPQTIYQKALHEDRLNDINLTVGISDEKGELILHGRGTGASFDAQSEQFDDQQIEIVPIVTLKDVCDEYCSKDREWENIHILKETLKKSADVVK